jgi:hypothetical protein
MIWLVIIYTLVIAAIVAAYTIPNERIEVRPKNKYQK